MAEALLGKLLGNFFIAMGVTLGGSLGGAAASLLLRGHPMDRLLFLSEEMRLWGILAAMSGSFEPLRGLEQGIFAGQGRVMLRQMLFLIVSMCGAHLGYVLLRNLGERNP